MKKYYYIAIAYVVFSTSCGPSAEEIAIIEQKKYDSVRIATENRLKNEYENKKKLEEEKKAKQDEISDVKNNLRYLKSKIDNAHGDLAGLMTKLENDQKFKFGRTPKQKQEWIANDVRDIKKKEREIEEMQSKINELEAFLLENN